MCVCARVYACVVEPAPLVASPRSRCLFHVLQALYAAATRVVRPALEALSRGPSSVARARQLYYMAADLLWRAGLVQARSPVSESALAARAAVSAFAGTFTSCDAPMTLVWHVIALSQQLQHQILAALRLGDAAPLDDAPDVVEACVAQCAAVGACDFGSDVGAPALLCKGLKLANTALNAASKCGRGPDDDVAREVHSLLADW